MIVLKYGLDQPAAPKAPGQLAPKQVFGDGALTTALPTSGNGSLPLAALLLAGAALGLLTLGVTLRRRAVR